METIMAPCPTYRTPKLLLSGLDSLYVSCTLDVGGSDLDFDELAYLKERVQASCADDFEEVEFGSETFALKPFGKYPYRYILANDLFEVRLAEQLQPSCYVRLYSQGLWLFGLDALWGRFADWCSSLNLIATKPEIVSRAVWAFDYHLPFVDFEPDHFVSRADKCPAWPEHSNTRTIAFGKGDTVIRFYNKAAEIAQQSGKAYLFELWDQSEDVWRIEFQARRGRLKHSGIKTIETLKDHQNKLLSHLARVHTTLRRPIEDTNKSRWPLHPLWKQLQRHIDQLPQTGLISEIDPKQPLNWRVLQQSKSIYGMLKGLAVLLTAQGRLPEDPTLSEVIAQLEPLLKRHHNANLWEADIEKRLKAYQIGQW
jgi:hypothetical protein